MDQRDLDQSLGGSPASLFGVGEPGGPLWTPEELGAVLRHQLAAELAFDLTELNRQVELRREAVEAEGHPPLRTFADLFAHPQPPADLLELTKQFARLCRERTDGPLPAEIATVLYVLSIVASRVRCRRRISDLDDAVLLDQVLWALAQPWLDPATRGLLEEGREALAPDGPGAPPTLRGAADSDATTPGAAPPAARAGLPDLSSPQLAALDQLGEYRVLRKLGEGGMGVVYQALHTELGRMVALKAVHPGRMTDDMAARFRREIRAAGRLDHPNVVRALDARKIDEVHVLVMEYVDGLDLHTLSARLAPLPVADACELVRQAGAGLAYAHQQGLVHRDVKPSNLMLSRNGLVKILDLGLARFQAGLGPSETTTVTGQMMGTLDYMAPEQLSDSHTAGCPADIYSLGCVLYKLLAGRAPFEDLRHETGLSKMAAQASEPPPPIRSLRADVPESLASVLDRMLAKDPQARFATAAEVVQALAPLAKGADLPGLLAGIEGRSPVVSTPAAPPPDAKGSSADTSPKRERGTEGETPSLTPRATLEHGADRRRARRIAALTLGAIGVGAILATLSVRYLDHRRDDSGNTRPGATGVVPGKPIVPTPPLAGEPSGWIAVSWASTRPARPDLWLFSPDGSRRINLTKNPRSFHIHPRFSPDGRRIAMVRGSMLLESNEVCVCNSDGSGLRPVVVSREKGERFASPVWLSNARLCYTRDPRVDRQPDLEIWETEVEGGKPRRMFGLRDALRQGGGLATDASPDGRQLAVIAQAEGLFSTADVYVTDLNGTLLHTIWEDKPDTCKDARALWSPDGGWIAWHHNFTPGTQNGRTRFGVGLAKRGADGRWTARLQPNADAMVTPLAWSPVGRYLLCLRLAESGGRVSGAGTFLMDHEFREVRALVDLGADFWQPSQRDIARLADWAIVPDDIAPRH